MPYKLSKAGITYFKFPEEARGNFTTNVWSELTDLQMKALAYLSDHRYEDRFIDAHEIATYYGLPSGNYFRGVLHSLYLRGLVDKKEG